MTSVEKDVMLSVHCYCKNMVYGCNDYILCFAFNKLFYCFVITTAVGGANLQHHRYTYYVAGIKSVSPVNHLVNRHRLNDHQRQIVCKATVTITIVLTVHTLKRW
jgi:hypothetical protein